jgi:hypothetical protein
MADRGGFNSLLTPPGTNPSSLSHVWESHKPVIKELYVDYHRSLKEVMKIMEIDHNFRAS